MQEAREVNKIEKIYRLLYEAYGPQGWWPFIKPSGYHNQKAKYVLGFIDFFQEPRGATPTREALLGVLGVGEETADSTLLYGYNQPEFKVDAYAKRVLLELGLIDENAKYADVKKTNARRSGGFHKRQKRASRNLPRVSRSHRQALKKTLLEKALRRWRFL